MHSKIGIVFWNILGQKPSFWEFVKVIYFSKYKGVLVPQLESVFIILFVIVFLS